MPQVDRSLTLLLAILTQRGRDETLVRWHQALHLVLMVAGNDVDASKEQRMICALITCSGMPPASYHHHCTVTMQLKTD